MNRLTGLDGLSLHGETSVMPTHVLAVLFCDTAAHGELTAGAILRLLGERTAAMPIFRQRLLTKPFGLGQPVWIEDPAFNVGDHLHRVRLPKPGTMVELVTLVGDLHAQRLRRDRPLWEAWVVHGLADGRLVVVMKFSHALTDGIGAVTSLLPKLMTTDPYAEVAVTPRRARSKTPVALDVAMDVIDEIAANTAVGARIAVKLAPGAVRLLAGIALREVRRLVSRDGPQRQDGQAPARQDESSPRTLLNTPITARRSVAFAAVAMDDLQAITDAFGVTVNDVFLTAATSAMRRWLQVNDTVPEQPLRTLMPISTRSAGEVTSNSWSPAVVKLPVDVADPVAQLASIRAETSHIKGRRRATPPVNLADVIDLVPPVIIGQAMGLYTGLKLSRFHSPVAHVITSNVPGPPETIYCAGSRVLSIHALAPLLEGTNLNITAVSYEDTLTVSIVACPDNVEDVASLAQSIEDVVSELKKAADERTVQRSEVARTRLPARTARSRSQRKLGTGAKNSTPDRKRPA